MQAIRIECPQCEWQPDGKIYWRCSCGHSWNTFDTKARCPNCNIQWEKTWCPGCGHSSPHKDWYIHPDTPPKKYTPEEERLRIKKQRLEGRLIALGIKNSRVSHLDYLDHSKENFQTPADAGRRMIILYAIAYIAHSIDERPVLIDWLKAENLWAYVSPEEQQFLLDKEPDEDTLTELSWRIEGAFTLAWALNLFDKLPEIDQEPTQEDVDEIIAKLPALGEPTASFVENCSYRNLEEVYEENLLNEMATAYFRDIMLMEREDETTINRFVSWERHRSLNWLRQHMGEPEWDHTDTST